MARVYNSSTQNRGDTYSRSEHFGSPLDQRPDQTDYSDSTSQRVINSPAYQSAHQILSAETDKQWLHELESIPYAVMDAPAENPLFGWASNKFEDKQNANYQYCMELIRDLMQRYHTWKNSLPTTQVSQFADAGYNAAITGQGLSSSDTGQVTQPTADPSSMESMNIGEVIGNVATTLLDVNSGLLSWANMFETLRNNAHTRDISRKQIDILRERWTHDEKFDYLNFNKDLASLGIDTVMWTKEDTDDFITRLGNSDFFSSNRLTNAIAFDDLNSQYSINLNVNEMVRKNMSEFVDFQYNIRRNSLEVQQLKLERDALQYQYDSGYYGSNAEQFGRAMGDIDLNVAYDEKTIKDFEADIAKYDADIAKLESAMSKATEDYLRQLSEMSKNGDMAASYVLSQILTGITPYDYGAARRGAGTYNDATYIGPAINAAGTAAGLIFGGKRRGRGR